MTTETGTPFPVIQSNARESFSYYGPREGWYITLSQHRDSDALERSNWSVITEVMLRWFPDDAAIERMNHWAVGWIEYLLVRPGTPAVTAAEGWRDRLANYPVADEEHHSMLEYDEEWCVRCDRGMRQEHPLHGCKFRSENDASEIRYAWEHRRDA